MRISHKQYALALYESIKEKKNAEIKQIIIEFVSLMARNNDISKAEKIVNEFIRVYNSEQGIIEAEIKSARALDGSIIKSLKDYIKEKTKAENVEIIQTENKSLLGGVVLKYGDKILDVSLKAKTRQLKNEIIK